MKTNDAMVEISKRLADIRNLLGLIEWNSAQVEDARLGEHLVAFEQHIDNAVGRLSTAAHCASRLQVG